MLKGQATDDHHKTWKVQITDKHIISSHVNMMNQAWFRSNI